MAELSNVRTIPEIFEHVLEQYGKDPQKTPMQSKVNDVYKGITYNELKEEVKNFAYGLMYLEIEKDDKISILSENKPEWIYSDLAIQLIGAVDIPLYPSLTNDSIRYIINDSDSVGIIVSNQFQLNKVLRIKDKCKKLKFIVVLNEKDVPPGTPDIYSFKKLQDIGKGYKKANPDLIKEKSKEVNEDDLCTIIYTSGTTGEPKGVMLSHKNIVSNVKAAIECLTITEKDSFLSFLPMCHIYERTTGYYMAFSCGCAIYFAESIEKVAQNLVETKPTIMTAVPRLFERMYSRIIKNVEAEPKNKQKIFYWAVEVGKKYQDARRHKKLSLPLTAKNTIAQNLVFKKLQERTGGNLRFFVSGGAPLHKELAVFFEAVGILVLEGYGLTETSPVVAFNRPDNYKFGTVGQILPGMEVKISEDGEILVNGPNVMQGYYKNEKETREVIKDGWLHTGDIGHIDEENFLTITDRKKHLFKTSGGKYIAPAPIENLFQSNKYIDQFVLIGDKRMYLTALIIPDFEAVREYADSHNIKYKKDEDLIEKEEIYKLIESELNKTQKSLANYEKVRKFALLKRPLSMEDGEITPSLKVRRKVIDQKFNDIINEMYKSL